MEDASVPFIPDCPRGEHGEGSHGLPIRYGRVGEPDPPLFGWSCQVSSGSVDVFELEPIFYHFSKFSSVPASEEEVVDGFLHALAKRTKPAIGHP